jgi:hypothetical protein
MDPLEIQIKLYDHLRMEILQAIQTQHRTFIAESFFVSMVFSFSLIGTIFVKSSENAPLSYINIISIMLLFIIAPGIIFFTSLWLIEQSRMMRAGDFLELLENDINSKLDGPYLIWENWLRRDTVKFLDIHRLHHYAQYTIIGMLLFFGFLSVRIIYLIKKQIPSDFNDITVVIITVYTVLLIILSLIYLKSIRHRTEHENTALEDDFKNFKSKYISKMKLP